YYAITVPALMITPAEEKACITIPKLKGELQLKMELKREQQSVLVTEDTIKSAPYFHCYSFELPTVVEEEEVWLFHVSTHGEALNINQTKKIMLMKGTHMTLIQTDKPMYKPGQTVNVRIVTLDRNLYAKNDKYPLVELIDPDKNRIRQWLDVSPHQGIADLSFPLANELPLGDYMINIPDANRVRFSVSEYVLKRLSLKANIPEKVSAVEKSFTVTACGSYTYGKPVSGTFELFVCKEDYRTINWYFYEYDQEDSEPKDMGNCQHITGVHTDDKGCISREFDIAFFNISSRYEIIMTKILLTDDVSGYTARESSETMITSTLAMSFEKIPEFYQKGIPFTAKLKVTDGKNQPVANETVCLVLGFEEEDLNLTSVTNEEGFAVFTVDTSTWDDMVSVEGRFPPDGKEERYYSQTLVWLHPLYSESNSFLTVDADTSSLSCDSDPHLTVEYSIKTSELDPADGQLHFFYFYVSKGAILSHGEHDIDIREQSLGSVLQGKFTLKIPVGPEYYPNFIFVVHTILENGDIPSYRKEFKIPACLKNKVTLKFSKEEVRTGEKVSLEVQADSGSLCSVRSVDKGLLLDRKHRTSEDSMRMLEMMSERVMLNKRGVPYSIEDFEKYPCLRNKKDPQAGLQEAAWYHGDADVYMMLKHSNLKIFTNTKIRKPVGDVGFDLLYFASKRGFANSKTVEEKKKPLKRTFFPETWLFDLVSVGPQGRTALDLTAPHSITTWETDAFCLGKSGFGEISGVELTTFQSYFIDLILPYSVVQGEEFPITAYVFSHVKSCMMVVSSIPVWFSLTHPSKVVGDNEQSQCICEDQTASFKWNVSASKLGNLKVHVSSTSQQLEGGCTDQLQTMGTDQKEDSIEKIILVKGCNLISFLILLGDSVRRTVTLEVPDKVIPGSEQAFMTVLGNLMGTAIYRLGEILESPSGSAEQNLADFIPMSHVFKYLESTKKLTPKIKERAIAFLTNGYLRQLLFKKADGSYSVFHGIPSSSWLTAFTLRSFSHAKDIIYIHNKHIEDAVKWLSSLQQPSGCFTEVGKVFNNYLMSDADNNVTLTAYIAIAMMEHGHVYDGSVIENALKCLKNAVDDVRTTYTQALLAYVFTLSNDEDQRKHMLATLDKAAIREDGNKYWAAYENSNGNVEITSYYLLALLSDQTTSQKDFEEATPIVNWIIKWQRSQGGFPSPQDTSVALQALTKYVKATYTDNQDVTLTVRSLSGFNKHIHIDKENSLVTQREILPDIPGEYTLTATGTGCAYIQTHLKYHTPLTKSDAYFTLNATTEPSVCTDEAKAGLDILVEAR
ncbi:hypothetical protein GDO78_023006, partial [Eleutherodactylus coqui]